jgi:hypothetical protein
VIPALLQTIRQSSSEVQESVHYIFVMTSMLLDQEVNTTTRRISIAAIACGSRWVRAVVASEEPGHLRVDRIGSVRCLTTHETRIDFGDLFQGSMLLLLLLFIDSTHASASPLRFSLFTRLSFIEIAVATAQLLFEMQVRPHGENSEPTNDCRGVSTNGRKTAEANVECNFTHRDLRHMSVISHASAVE